VLTPRFFVAGSAHNSKLMTYTNVMEGKRFCDRCGREFREIIHRPKVEGDGFPDLERHEFKLMALPTGGIRMFFRVAAVLVMYPFFSYSGPICCMESRRSNSITVRVVESTFDTNRYTRIPILNLHRAFIDWRSPVTASQVD
jgi:hypothetical protein